MTMVAAVSAARAGSVTTETCRTRSAERFRNPRRLKEIRLRHSCWVDEGVSSIMASGMGLACSRSMWDRSWMFSV